MRDAMKRTNVLACGLLIVAALVAGDRGVRAEGSEDDLTVVKRAVQQGIATTPQALPDERPTLRPGAKPLWLRVRVTERNGKRVRVNLPLALVRAVGDWPIDFGCGWDGERRRCKLRISQVLEALDAGQSLVEVDDEGATVRIWVE